VVTIAIKIIIKEAKMANKESVIDSLKKLIEESNPSIDVNAISEDTKLEEDLQMGSLEMYELTMAVEEEFDFTFEDEEQEQLMDASVGALVEVILAKIS
tara:strand:+ start:120 stop:416 length:297 start_codon:yes stop_codon:yes gene_type:complete